MAHEILSALSVTGLASFTTAGIALPLGQDVVKFGTWATRPSSPYSGQRFFCNDSTDARHDKQEWFWDVLASNWLSTQQHRQEITAIQTACTTFNSGWTVYTSNFDHTHNAGFVELYDIYVMSVNLSYYTGPTYNASNYWVVSINKFDNTAITWGMYAYSYSTWATGRVANRFYPTSIQINTVWTTQYNCISLSITKGLGAPGTLVCYSPVVCFYRRVG